MKKIIISFFVIALALTFVGTVKATSLAESLSGKILLQVEENGEAWYVYPDDHYRYFLGRPSHAFEIMRNLGLGISEINIAQIPIGLVDSNGADSDNDGLSDDLETAIGTSITSADSDNDGYSDKMEIENWYNPNGSEKLPTNINVINSTKGKILLQTEKNGEAWYLNPNDSKRYYLGRPADAFQIMRNLGLGVSNGNFNQMPDVSYLTNGGGTQDLLAKANCGSFDCFEAEFTNCKVGSKIVISAKPLAVMGYEIIGPENNKCKMQTIMIESMNPSWANQAMTCEYDNSLSFAQAGAAVTAGFAQNNTGNCTGNLYGLLMHP
ncbi:hypothetical protein HQ571_06760 [Candidatus Kuenenbacteria bacterium]|nr:hypothetical protein [Candidatus Kuenenbacteria bacterium]